MLRRMTASYEAWSKVDLIRRIKELESMGLVAAQPPSDHQAPDTSDPSPTPSKKRKREFDFSKYYSRKIAIKFAYLGWNYHGLALQKDPQTVTVEQKILEALAKTRCVPSLNPLECEFSRCGRTDRDVSAMAQVISLTVRSLLTPEEQQDSANDARELDYLRTLNSQLPDDIFAYQICLRPPEGFDARFSCKFRHYRYFFNADGLDLEAMALACRELIGEHDFRNFCKIDATKQITNYVRSIQKADIVAGANGLHYLDLQGNAFLWNQVRSIMAVLFMIGQGHEPVSTITRLLDIKATPRRPAYTISWGVPLVLYDCVFPDMEWTTSPGLKTEFLFGSWYGYLQRANMAKTMLDVVLPSCPPSTRQACASTFHNPANTKKHTSLFSRPLLKTPEVVNREWLEKQAAKGGLK